ncbi:MAG: diadenylate cyclase CdaA [Oscillospiraceae bacterium]|jgi:diadenylate cyclase|nr:diadenylate cyclase CdaA [Oscillospiraceae bacterium]
MEVIESALLRMWSDVKTIGVGDVLDVLIIAYIIYRVLSVVRRTSAGSVIKGVILLVAVLGLSSVLKLNVLNYLLGQAMAMGVIILVILFQPELRRLLEQFGSSNFKLFSGRRAQSGGTEEVIELVVSACADMSRSKTGALIVFERGIGLGDYAATGTAIGAVVSAELVKQIFYPNTPLHDGAALIRDGRILAAGCMLPMSSNPALSRDLGMRHKAGIGISERSDAVSVVVSEETGAISVAVEGMLKRHLSRDTFAALLRSELISDSRRGERKQKKDDRKKNATKKDVRGNI